MNIVNDGNALIGNVLQGLAMAGILGWSVFFMLRRSMPKLVSNQQRQLANVCNAQGWTKLAQWLEPTIATSGGCGSGCNTCGSCASNPNKEVEQAVQWKNLTPSKNSECH